MKDKEKMTEFEIVKELATAQQLSCVGILGLLTVNQYVVKIKTYWSLI